jgi:hypothetical protein
MSCHTCKKEAKEGEKVRFDVHGIKDYRLGAHKYICIIEIIGN